MLAPAVWLGCMTAPLAFAASPEPLSTQPDPALKVLRQPTLRGEARLRFFGFSVYRARLWTEPDFNVQNYASHPLVLELNYERSLKGDAIAERSLEEMRRGRTLTQAQESEWLAAMRRTFPDVDDGDRLTGVYRPGQASLFALNGQARAPVRDAAFGPAFFGIWLADHTSEPALRRQLLGLDAGTQ